MAWQSKSIFTKGIRKLLKIRQDLTAIKIKAIFQFPEALFGHYLSQPAFIVIFAIKHKKAAPSCPHNFPPQTSVFSGNFIKTVNTRSCHLARYLFFGLPML